MTLAILSLLAAVLDLFAVGIAWRHARRVAHLTSGATRNLTASLKRVPHASRASELFQRAPPGSFEHTLAAELLAAAESLSNRRREPPEAREAEGSVLSYADRETTDDSGGAAACWTSSDTARIAAANDALLEAEHALRRGAAWPRAGIRIALAGGLLFGLSAWLTTGNLRAAVILVAVGGASALLCIEAGRSAKRHADAQRADIDALITAVLGPLADPPPSPAEARGPAGRRPSRRRRSP